MLPYLPIVSGSPVRCSRIWYRRNSWMASRASRLVVRMLTRAPDGASSYEYVTSALRRCSTATPVPCSRRRVDCHASYSVRQSRRQKPRMVSYRVVIGSGSNGARSESTRRLTRLELLKFGVVGLFGLVGALAFLIAASVIGLLLAVTLIAVGLCWLVYLILRGKIRLERHLTTVSTTGRHPSADPARERTER
jgi:hypothetical protein